jgi:hypothetical protein
MKRKLVNTVVQAPQMLKLDNSIVINFMNGDVTY